MKRIDSLTADTDKHGSGKNGFQDPATGTPTNVKFDWFDHAQEESAVAIESGKLGHTLDSTSYQQLYKAMVSGRMADTFFQAAFAPGGTSTAGAMDVDCLAAPYSPLESTTYSPYNAAGWAAVTGTNMLLVSHDQGRTFASAGSVTGTMKGVAIANSALGVNFPVAVAVGDGGVWYRYQLPGVAGGSGTLTNGTIPGTPNLDQVIWDDQNDLWWGVGAGGIYKAADNATALSWTQVSATQHANPGVIRTGANAGRVLFWLNSSDTCYYTDDASTLTAGIAVTGATDVPHCPVWDEVNGRMVFQRFDSTSYLSATTDGVAAAVGIGGPDFRAVPVLLGNRVCAVGEGGPTSDPSLGVFLHNGNYTTAGWAARVVGCWDNDGGSTALRAAGCGDFFIAAQGHASNGVIVSRAMAGGVSSGSQGFL